MIFCKFLLIYLFKAKNKSIRNDGSQSGNKSQNDNTSRIQSKNTRKNLEDKIEKAIALDRDFQKIVNKFIRQGIHKKVIAKNAIKAKIELELKNHYF